MMMQAVQALELGALDQYHITSVPVPMPGPGQARIRVVASGLGYVDVLLAAGQHQFKPRVPYIPGSEVAGVIDALGDAVMRWRIGDRVTAVAAGGCLAQWLVADASRVAELPPGLSFEQGACLRVNYATALHALQDRARLQAGESLLVLGAAGGVGIAAVQVGRALGARVIAAASTPEKRQFTLDHGAHHAIDYRAPDWRAALKAIEQNGVDVVFDPVCGATFEAAFRSLAWRGRHLVVGFVGGPIPALRCNLALVKGAALLGVDVRQFQLLEEEQSQSNEDKLSTMALDHRLRPPTGAIFPLGRFREAMANAANGTACGKTVLRIAEP